MSSPPLPARADAPDADLLGQLLAEREVMRRLYDYCEAADADTPDAFLDCFTASGLFTHTAHGQSEPVLTLRGHAELERWFVERLALVPPGTMNHTTVHPRVQIEGDRASCRSRFISLRARQDGLYVASTGGYQDVLQRCEDGQWRLAERHSRGDMPRPR
jgi:ketosteroid isomerase-like protein